MRRRLSGRTRPILALGTIAASGLALAGCGDSGPAQDVLFKSVDQCVQAGTNEQVCQAAYQDAMRAHLDGAPRFNGQAACEAEYGAGQCTETRAAAGSGSSGSFFMPFMAGYMLSRGINTIDDYYKSRRREQDQSGAYRYSGSAPIYRTRSGQTVTTAPVPAGGTQSTGVSSPGYKAKPANVNTRTVARQGFGGRSSSFGFGG
ncbi:hypothetical protein GCM10011491_29530 [Brucella endophytica]|uniref:DUF1190 domain-containing protein n=1 Tax=Brucella endophytica TaxID=1963359 RepID=A0A916WGP8_9HYPH|nr:DUF1190 domain-containing protein [Brucella endophytica]GGA99351.1 hypothetical protein GCM10011491_29530 [Brucella endophytica]